MKKHLVIAIITTSLTSLTSSFAATNSAWMPSSMTLRSGLTSKYIAFTTGVELYNKPTFQSDLFTTWDCGVYVDLWNSFPMNGSWQENYGSEVDYGAGWIGPLSQLGFGGFASDLKLDAGTLYFDEPRVFTLGKTDVLDTHVKLSKEFKWLTAMVGYENYFAMPNSVKTYGGANGNVIMAGVSKGGSLWKNRLDASAFMVLEYDTGTLGLRSGMLLRGGGELDWALTKRISVFLPQVNYYAPLNTADCRKLDIVVGGGFTVKLW